MAPSTYWHTRNKRLWVIFIICYSSITSLSASLVPSPDTTEWKMQPYHPHFDYTNALKIGALLRQKTTYPSPLPRTIENRLKRLRAAYELFLKPLNNEQLTLEPVTPCTFEKRSENPLTIVISETYLGKIFKKSGFEICDKKKSSSYHLKLTEPKSFFTLSPSGNFLAIPTGTTDEHVIIYATQKGDPVLLLTSQDALPHTGAQFSPDEQYLATISGSYITLLNFRHKAFWFTKLFTPTVKTVHFLPDNNHLVIHSSNKDNSAIHMVNMETRQTTWSTTINSPSNHLSLSATGRIALVTTSNSLHIYDLFKKMCLNTLSLTGIMGGQLQPENEFHHVTLHPSLPLMAIILNKQQGLYLMDFTGEKFFPVTLDKYLTNAAFSPDGMSLFAGTTEGLVVEWSLEALLKPALILRMQALKNEIKKHPAGTIFVIPKKTPFYKILHSLPSYLEDGKNAWLTRPNPHATHSSLSMQAHKYPISAQCP